MILVFGKTGQVATALQRILPTATYLGRDKADLSQPQLLGDIIKQHNPSCIINAAAYTAVDKAEEEIALANTINGEAPTEMAKACAALDIPFLHISTDYVFDGTGDQPLTEDGTIDPINTYGASKALGEEGIREVTDKHIILRTAWVYGPDGNNFLKTMLKLSGRDELNVIADQHGTPTTAAAIAAALVKIANNLKNGNTKFGTYHFTGGGQTTWHGFASEIFRQAEKKGIIEKSPTVNAIPTTEYPTPAARPAWSVLNCSKVVADHNVHIQEWEVGVQETLKQLAN